MLLEALLYAIVGGFFFGTYPLFIRTQPVLKVKPHPIVFQLYKSTVVFICGFFFLIPRYFNWKDESSVPLFVFNWWGVASAVLWIPAGLTTIFSVPIIGMGIQVATAASSASIVSFLSFWLIFGTKMKEHSCGERCVYYLAPLYLFFTITGMIAVIFSEKLAFFARKICCSNTNLTNLTSYQQQNKEIVDKVEETTSTLLPTFSENNSFDDEDIVSSSSSTSIGKFALGIIASMIGGVSASAEFAVIQQGKKIEEINANCFAKNITCPPKLIESFNTFGSWMVSFGFGAFGITLLLFIGLGLYQGRIPNVHWNVLKFAGVKAGLFWVLGNLGTTLAVVRGGNAVVLSQSLGSMIITSGLWGLVYYKEGDLSLLRRFIWFASALFTVTSMILLGMEKLS
jgi:hypothetical protein